ncbi:hypothetical protein ACQZV8_20005 [Magnetococcales bacterium HHB-1]
MTKKTEASQSDQHEVDEEFVWSFDEITVLQRDLNDTDKEEPDYLEVEDGAVSLDALDSPENWLD